MARMRGVFMPALSVRSPVARLVGRMVSHSRRRSVSAANSPSAESWTSGHPSATLRSAGGGGHRRDRITDAHPHARPKERIMATDRIGDHGRRDFLRIAGGSLAVLAVAGRPGAAAAQTSASQLKIGMIGSGREGGALGKLFAKAGHPVMFSSRHPENLKDLRASAGPHAPAG